MIRIFVILLFSFFILPEVRAEIDPLCQRTCLKDGYYSITCDSICNADEKLGDPFKIAGKQYKCLRGCKEKQAGDTLMECVLGCRQAVRDNVLGEKKAKFVRSIVEAEQEIKEKNAELEKRIDEGITSKRIEKIKPEPLVIE